MLGVLLAAAVLAAPAPGATLTAETGGETADASYIWLRDADGNAVTQLAGGTYTIVVRDTSTHHNVHIQGAPYTKVNRRTAVEWVGEETWTVTFVDGEYWYACDPHRSTMHGEFTVGSGKYVPPKAKPKPKKKAKPKPKKKGKAHRHG